MASEANTAAPAGSAPVRVALIDDDELVLEGLRGMLAPHRDRVEVKGQLPLTEDLLPVATELGAQVALSEVQPGGTRPLELVDRLVTAGPPFRVVVFTHQEDVSRMVEAFQLGAAGYLLKSVSGNELAELLVRVRAGEVVVGPTMAARLAMRATRQVGTETWPGSQLGLTLRESDVVRQLVTGAINRDIAAELHVGEETVKTHLRSIYKKLGVRDRAQAVARVLRENIFT